MNINKFTQKSLQAVQNCERIAMDYGNQEIAQEHLLYALLTQDDSLIAKLMEKMGLDKNLIINRVEEAIQKRPKVQGGQQYVGQDLNNALVHGEDEAKAMGDEYVSVEHLFLAMMKYASKDMKALFREVGISKEGFLQAALYEPATFGTGSSSCNTECDHFRGRTCGTVCDQWIWFSVCSRIHGSEQAVWSFGDGCRFIWVRHYNLCGPESWCKKIPEDSKRCTQRHLYGSAHFGFHFWYDGVVWT